MKPERPSATTARSSVTFLDEATGPAISGVALQHVDHTTIFRWVQACSAAIWTGKSVNQDWKVQSRQTMIDAARQEGKSFLILPRVNRMEF
jgi:hypothetical protein